MITETIGAVATESPIPGIVPKCIELVEPALDTPYDGIEKASNVYVDAEAVADPYVGDEGVAVPYVENEGTVDPYDGAGPAFNLDGKGGLDTTPLGPCGDAVT